MKRTIFLLGLITLFAVPVAQANHQFGDASDRAKNDVHVIPYLSQGALVGPGMAHDMDESVICNASGCLPRMPDAFDRAVASQTAAANDVVVDYGPLKTHGGPILPLEDRQAIEESAAGSVYHRADDFAPPRDVTVPSASATSVDWSETAMWLVVGLAGSLGLLGAALLANRSRVRTAQS